MKINTNWVKNNQTIKIPLCPSSFFNDDSLSISVNWGDGNSETVTSFSGANQITDDSGNVVCNLLTHTYNNGNGFKTITITGGYGNKIAFMQSTKQDANGDVEDLPVYGTRWRFLKIYECNTGTQFYIHGQGDFRGFGRLNAIGSNIASLISDNPASSIALSDASTATMFMDKTFFKCTKLRYFGQFDPANVTSLQYTLSECMKLDKCKAINNWDMEKVTIATGACKDSAISVGLWKWFMESEGKDYAIEDMSGMFEGADFNKGINGWDLSTVKDTSNMFKGSNFNKPIWKWFKNDNVLEKTDGMFQDNDDFSKDLSTWDISNVSSKVNMFDGALQMSQAKVPDTIVLPSPTPTPSSSAAVTPTPTPSVSASTTGANFALSFDNGTYDVDEATFTVDSNLGQINGKDTYSATVSGQKFTVAFAYQLASSGGDSCYGGWFLYANNGTLNASSALRNSGSTPYIVNGVNTNPSCTYLLDSWEINLHPSDIEDANGNQQSAYFNTAGIYLDSSFADNAPTYNGFSSVLPTPSVTPTVTSTATPTPTPTPTPSATRPAQTQVTLSGAQSSTIDISSQIPSGWSDFEICPEVDCGAWSFTPANNESLLSVSRNSSTEVNISVFTNQPTTMQSGSSLTFYIRQA